MGVLHVGRVRGVWLWIHKDSRIHLTSLLLWIHYDSTKYWGGEIMVGKARVSPFPLRLLSAVRDDVQVQANKNRRSLNAELGLLVEEGLKWRLEKSKQAAA